MTADNIIKAELLSFAAQEAGGGGYDQILAVACVLANRRRRGWHGGDWMKILEHAAEVAALEPRPRKLLNLAAPEIRRMLVQVDDIYTGNFHDDLTGANDAPGKPKKGGGLYYADALWNDYGGVMRPWFQEKILNDPSNHPRVAQVGMLYIFS